MARIKVEGAAELQRALLELGQKEAAKLGRASLRKAARAILLAARANVPVGEGRLKRALTVEVDRGRNRSWLFANVKVRKGPDYRPRKTDRETTIKGKKRQWGYPYQVGSTPEVYGAILEFGAPARNIAPRGWMRRAWDALGGRFAVERIGNDLGTGIELAAKRLMRS